MTTRKVGFLKMSTRARYGLRMLIELAFHYQKGVLPLRVISDNLGVSKKYLERIARMLENAGLIRSEKGVKGGYKLAKPAHKIKIYNVLATLEGDLALSDCLVTECDRKDNCLANRFWVKLGSNIKDFLDQLSIADLLQEVQ